MAKSIRDQILETADYISPDAYARLLFGQPAQYPISYDSTSLQFIPVTQVKPNPKMFVIGVIPPSADVTGKLLDRSASVANRLQASSGQVLEANTTENTTANVFLSNGSVAVDESGGPLPPSFWMSYIQMCHRLGVDPKLMGQVLTAESGFKPENSNLIKGKGVPPVAKGLNQLTWDTAMRMGMPREVWDVYDTYTAEQQLPWVELYFRRSGVKGKTGGEIYKLNFGGYPNKDGSLYASKEAQEKYMSDNGYPLSDISLYFGKNFNRQYSAIKQNPGLVGKAGNRQDGRITQADLDANLKPLPGGFAGPMETAEAALGGAKPPPFRSPVAKPEAPAPTSFAGEGAANAAQSRQEGSKTQGKDLNTTDLGKQYQAAQMAEISATQFLLESMRNTPPLRFLVNPSNFKQGMEKISNDGNWTRNGPIVEHWGDGQDKLDFSGKVAAFMALDANSPNPDDAGGGPGLTRIARTYSAGYQNFLSLWMFYRNNGGIFNLSGQSATATGSMWSRLSMMGTVYIFYDDTLYFGSFDSFDVTEEDTAPFTLSYSIQFTVRASVLLDTPRDPREGEYGATGIRSVQVKSDSLPTTSTETSDGVFAPVNAILRKTAEVNKAILDKKEAEAKAASDQEQGAARSILSLDFLRR